MCTVNVWCFSTCRGHYQNLFVKEIRYFTNLLEIIKVKENDCIKKVCKKNRTWFILDKGHCLFVLLKKKRKQFCPKVKWSFQDWKKRKDKSWMDIDSCSFAEKKYWERNVMCSQAKVEIDLS